MRVRCLQTQRRRVEARLSGAGRLPRVPRSVPSTRSRWTGRCHVEWDEAVDRVVDLPPLVIPPGGNAADELSFHLEGGSEVELVHRADGTLVGRFVRERMPVDGAVRVATAPEPMARRT